jgi:hypothetical protein
MIGVLAVARPRARRFAIACRPNRSTVDVVRRVFESAGIEFVDENGGGPGVRHRKRVHKKPGK